MNPNLDARKGTGHGFSGRVRDHLRSNVVGYVALFLVLTGGSAYALQGSNTVFTDDIVNGQVKSEDLGLNAVRTGKIEDGQVKALDLAPNSVGTLKIANGGVQGPDLAFGSVGSFAVADDSLTGADINESSLGAVPQAGNASTLDNHNSTSFGVGTMGGLIDGLTAGNTANHPPIGLSSASGTFVAPAAGRFVARDLEISLTSNLGADQTRSFAFVRGGSVTPLSCTVNANEDTCSNTTDGVAVNAGQRYAIRQTSSTGSPANVDVQFGWRALSP